ncbi:class I SAM-dependent DNA methyltransferase [Paenisporosarcina sp. NPDC076907]|uniref:class I SAM-dependent DNA methyltransferase n=1 Tax=Paenisporosarcina sp. NPDC076907 TaxID=3390604 RepID=UPI003D086A90
MTKHALDIFENNMEKYNDPEYYDLQYQNYLKDFPLILEWAEKINGEIIDLACGTGRLTIPLAQKGFKLTGVDINEGMLDRARKKTRNTNLPIQWELQDCTKLKLNKSGSLIYMTGNSFQHFLTNEAQNNLFQSVHAHLIEEGIFIFNTRFPILSELAIIDESKRTYVDKRMRKVTEYEVDSYDPLTQILTSTSTREILNDQNQVVSTEKDRILLRYVFPMEMERLIEQNGFSILYTYDSWNKSPIQKGSTELIYVCQKSSSL